MFHKLNLNDMNRFLSALSSAFVAITMLASCGTANQASTTIASVSQDDACISFISKAEMPIIADVDGEIYEIKALGEDAKDQETVANSVVLTPGKHVIRVKSQSGTELYKRTVYISPQEHKVVDL